MNILALLQHLALWAAAAVVAFLAFCYFTYVFLALPRGRRTRSHTIWIAADPKTVWNTFFFHVGGINFRPGIHKRSAEVLATDPLIVRTVSQLDLRSTPSVSTMTYDAYEPHRYYRAHLSPRDIVTEAEEIEAEEQQEVAVQETQAAAPADDGTLSDLPGEAEVGNHNLEAEADDLEGDDEPDDPPIFEEGELQEEAGGTRLTLRIHSHSRGFLVPWTARRRTDRNLLSLKRVCEGGDPLPPHEPLKWQSSDLGLVAVPLALLLLNNSTIRIAAAACLGCFFLLRTAAVLRRL